jgi:predicted nuclease with TOPRIM domain
MYESTELSREEIDSLNEERIWCRENLKTVNKELNDLIMQRNKCLDKFLQWKRRFERADRKLALATKLTIVKPRGPQPKDALEKVLQDKDKTQQLIDLLTNEIRLQGGKEV